MRDLEVFTAAILGIAGIRFIEGVFGIIVATATTIYIILKIIHLLKNWNEKKNK